MEQMLWDVACSIRGAKDAAKFKDYLLPLLFLKRLSDVFDDEIDRLADEYGDRAVAQEIAESDHELLRFYLPPEARWGVVSGRETYDWPLDDRGQSAGEFFTPTEVGFLMAHIMGPRPGEDCYDYACGSAGLLIKLRLVAREADPTSRVPLKLYGQELQADSYAVAHMNAIIHDMEVQIERGDTMVNPKFKNAAGRIATHDIVVANPMWNQDFNPDIFENDPFDRFRTAGGVTTGKGDWVWPAHPCLPERPRTGGGGAGHRRRDARLRQQERGQGAQHP